MTKQLVETSMIGSIFSGSGDTSRHFFSLTTVGVIPMVSGFVVKQVEVFTVTFSTVSTSADDTIH